MAVTVIDANGNVKVTYPATLAAVIAARIAMRV